MRPSSRHFVGMHQNTSGMCIRTGRDCNQLSLFMVGWVVWEARLTEMEVPSCKVLLLVSGSVRRIDSFPRCPTGATIPFFIPLRVDRTAILP